MFLMGPVKQLKRMCDKTRAFATTVMIVSYCLTVTHTTVIHSFKTYRIVYSNILGLTMDWNRFFHFSRQPLKTYIPLLSVYSIILNVWHLFCSIDMSSSHTMCSILGKLWSLLKSYFILNQTFYFLLTLLSEPQWKIFALTLLFVILQVIAFAW